MTSQDPLMKPVWRWFGPNDPVTLEQIKQAGATGVVTALHDYPAGKQWPVEEIREINDLIVDHGLTWDVCESIWMPDAIKLHGAAATAELGAWIDTMRALADVGVKTICYNFMPLLDWTRTDLEYQIEGRGRALRFDMVDFAVFDIHVLMREDAEQDYNLGIVRQAHERYAQMTSEDDALLERNIIAGLPGSATAFTSKQLSEEIARFAQLSHADLHANLASFLEVVVPIAQALDVQLAIHPDDPPMPLFGLPRCVSTADDLRTILQACPSPANGLTFCTGSLGAHIQNDLPEMAQEFGDHVHFAHLRNVKREPDGSFHESAVFDGSTNMIEVLKALLETKSRNGGAALPFRPDHGHLLDVERDQKTNPGYSYVGRLKGLSELNGAIAALSAVPAETKVSGGNSGPNIRYH